MTRRNIFSPPVTILLALCLCALSAFAQGTTAFTYQGRLNNADPLTSSATEPGKAMKATGAGKIIGIALESSAKAQDGKLLMWLQVGYNAPAQPVQAGSRPTASRLPRQIKQLKAENAALQTQLTALQQAVCALNPKATVCK